MAALIVVHKVHVVLISSRAMPGRGHDVFPYYHICARRREALLFPALAGVSSGFCCGQRGSAEILPHGSPLPCLHLLLLGVLLSLQHQTLPWLLRKVAQQKTIPFFNFIFIFCTRLFCCQAAELSGPPEGERISPDGRGKQETALGTNMGRKKGENRIALSR